MPLEASLEASQGRTTLARAALWAVEDAGRVQLNVAKASLRTFQGEDGRYQDHQFFMSTSNIRTVCPLHRPPRLSACACACHSSSRASFCMRLSAQLAVGLARGCLDASEVRLRFLWLDASRRPMQSGPFSRAGMVCVALISLVVRSLASRALPRSARRSTPVRWGWSPAPSTRWNSVAKHKLLLEAQLVA